MKKSALLAFAIVGIAFTACKEKGPLIDFGSAKAEDTTYITTTPGAPQERMILIEEFTGGSCPFCPAGHEIIYSSTGIKSKFPGRVAVIAYHIFNYPQANPVKGEAKYDFRTQDATDVAANIFGAVSAMPVASFDRTPEGADLLLDRLKWASKSNTRAGIAAPANVTIDSKFDATTRQAEVTVKVVYTSPVAKKQALTLSLIESGIVDAQEKESEIIKDYVHNAVLRDIITPYYGSPMLDSLSTKVAGRVYERTFKFNVNDAWNADHCELVAFVHNNESGDKEVVQTAEKALK